MGDVLFSPANQLLWLIKEYAKDKLDMRFTFPRWNISGTALRLVSASGGHLLTVDFDHKVIIHPDFILQTFWVERHGKLLDKEIPIPAEWMKLHAGSLFDSVTGDALHPEEFAYSGTLNDWRGNL